MQHRRGSRREHSVEAISFWAISFQAISFWAIAAPANAVRASVCFVLGSNPLCELCDASVW